LAQEIGDDIVLLARLQYEVRHFSCGVERKACSAVLIVLLIFAMAAKLGALPRSVA
jgi:hypothetical protein